MLWRRNLLTQLPDRFRKGIAPSGRLLPHTEQCRWNARSTGTVVLRDSLFFLLEHLTLEMLAYGRQKPTFSHFVARIFKKILAEELAHFIR
ncbi:hypothetical protein DW219_02285 [Desulfovibrio sp. AM18-2]|nr:hypothetical protein DW219_02285 [Desulfovibrio sp. AM18-2]